MLSNRRNITLVLCGLTLATSLAILAARAQSNAPQAAPKLAEEEYKNIQALKGVPADQIFPSMQFITASLGVECDYCHVREGQKMVFDKDDKKTKQTARKMMEMMFAINKENFDGHREVTCYSCHRGAIDPIGTPSVMTEEAKPGVEVAKNEEKIGEGGPSGPNAELLFSKYLQAVGGAAATDKITSRVMKGTITFGDRNVPIEIFSKDPDKRVSFTYTPDGDSITAFDGHEGWLGTPKRPVHEMHGPDVDAAAMDADLHFAAHLKNMFTEAKVRGTEKIDGHDAYVVVGQREAKTPVRLYFDEK